jgi:hypothetical protein
VPIGGRGLTQTADNCFIHTQVIAGQQTARAVIGAIHRQDTGNRGNPPLCLSGFGTGGTPFALGHVMALELGGADISANIVPQYGQWQGNQLGAWRAMEVAVSNDPFKAHVFVALLDYGAGPFVDTWLTQYNRFSGGDKLFHWQEARIPTRFRVWTLRHDWSAGTIRIADYFPAADHVKEAGLDPLLGALPATRLVFDETIGAMPGIDRQYWRKQMLNQWLRQRYAEYEDRTNQKILASQITNVRTGRPVRTAAQRPHVNLKTHRPTAPPPKKAPVLLSYARWLGDDDKMTSQLAALKSTIGPPPAVTGWTQIEVNGLDLSDLRAAVFQA